MNLVNDEMHLVTYLCRTVLGEYIIEANLNIWKTVEVEESELLQSSTALIQTEV